MKNGQKISLLILLTLCASRLVTAQESSFSLRCLSLDGSEVATSYVTTSKGVEKLEFGTFQPSKRIQVKGSGVIAIYAEVPSEDKPSKPSQMVELPSSAAEVLLLGWQEGKKVRYTAIPDTVSTSKRWLLINASHSPIAFQIGEKQKPLVIKPGDTKSFLPSSYRAEGLPVKAMAEVNGKARKIYSTYWPVKSAERCLILFVPDGDDIKVKRIVEIPETKKS